MTQDAESNLAWEARHRPRAAIAAFVAALGLLVYNVAQQMLAATCPTASGLEALVRAVQPGPVGDLPSLRIPVFEYIDSKAGLAYAQMIGGFIGFVGIGWAVGFLAVATRSRHAQLRRFMIYAPIVGGVVLGVPRSRRRSASCRSSRTSSPARARSRPSTDTSNSLIQVAQLLLLLGTLRAGRRHGARVAERDARRAADAHARLPRDRGGRADGHLRGCRSCRSSGSPRSASSCSAAGRAARRPRGGPGRPSRGRPPPRQRRPQPAAEGALQNRRRRRAPGASARRNCAQPAASERSATTLGYGGGDVMATEGQTLEQQLEELLDQERFPPPDGFAEHAVVSDAGIYEQAEDYEAFWAERAEALHWDTKWDQVLDWSNPPFAKWFVGGKLNVSYNCLDRHVEAGNGDRVAYHWRGEEGEELDVTYADLHGDVQRFANALKSLGVAKGDVVAIYLPMIPEVAVAMLACARIGAIHNVVFGGFSAESVRERIEFSEAKVLITVDGARRKGKTAAIKENVDEVIGDLVDTIVVVKRADNDAPMKDGRDHFYGDAAGGRGRRVPGRADGLRGPALHPLHERLDGQAQGHPAHHRRLSDRRRLHAQGGVRPQGGGGHLLVRRRRRLGHRALLHRLRAAGQRRDLGHVRGRARLPRQGHLVGARRALQGDDHVLRADRDPRVHEVGRRAPRGARPVARCACSGRSASRSTRRPGCGTGRWSAAAAARSSTPGGRPRRARS